MDILLMAVSYENLEWIAAAGEGISTLVLLLAVYRLESSKYSRHQSKNRLTLVPLRACLALVLLLMLLMIMDLICSDHTDFELWNNLTHKIKRLIEAIGICIGCFVTAIQVLEWSLLECMIKF
jgi:hypothetical protein